MCFMNLLTLTACFAVGVQDSVFTMTSPNQKYQCQLTYRTSSDKTELFYQINYDQTVVIEPSSLAIELDNHLSEWALAIKDKPQGHWMDALELTGVEQTQVDTSWINELGERRIVPDHYQQYTYSFTQKSSSNYQMDIQIRVYDEGVAFRYYFHTNPTGIYYRITEENSEFTFPADTKAWFEPWAQGPLTKMPLSDWPSESERPLTLELSNGLYACIAEAGVVDYVRTKFNLHPTKPNTVQTAMYEAVDMVPYFATPWRVIMAGHQPGELIEHNYLLLNLNEPSRIQDTDWIKPGKIVRDLTLSEKGAKDWIDFAHEHHLQYILFDWLWYGPAFTWDSDAGTVDSTKMKMDLQEVIDYGKERQVGIWVYVNQQALKKQDFEIFPKYKAWGLAGVKYGFVQVGSRYWTDWLHQSVQRAAENQLMVNIHDEFRVTGEQRTWPNIMTVEGIRGNEEMPKASHNVTLPFTRGIAGMGDYTICYYTPRIKTTHAHQLALSVVMFSPLQTLFWYDNPSNYQGEPEIQFFEDVPTVWDETKILKGSIGHYIITARRKGNIWYIGAITNEDGERNIEISMDFLNPKLKYKATQYTDDINIDSKTHVAVSERKVTNKSVLSFKLNASGGCALKIEPTHKNK